MTIPNLVSGTIVCCLFLLSIHACKDDEMVPSGISQIILSPDTLMINDQDTGTIFLSIQPGSQQQWNISGKPDWISIQPLSGMIKNEIIELQVIPVSTGLNQGKYHGDIEIITNGAGKDIIHVILCVDAHPLAEVQPNPVIISATEEDKDIVLTNIGTGFLNWSITSRPAWIGITYFPGPLDANESTTIRLHTIRDGLPPGLQNGQLIITSNSEAGDLVIPIEMETAAGAILAVSPDSVKVGYFDDHQYFYVINDGNIPFNWTFDANGNSYLSAQPSSGNVPAGDSIKVDLKVDRTQLSSQEYKVDFIIHTDQASFKSIPVIINHYMEEKWLIDGRVMDAEYDRVNDVLILVTENPNEIRKYNFTSHTNTSLELNYIPTCVSVSKDGTHAAVGHSGSFTYVDVGTMQMVQNYPVPTNALDIILAPNDWVYVFPAEDQWEHVRCINLSTGNVTEHTGNLIYAGTVAKLHPSGNTIYGANSHLSPSDFEKYSISGGTATYLWDSPYHGDYDFNGNIWISEDGNRLFAKSRNVFTSSATQANDMNYSGTLSGTGNIQTLDFSLNAGKIYTVFSSILSGTEIPESEVRIYGTQFLSFEKTVPLAGFLVPDGTGDGTFYKSWGQFGFFNSAGTQYYAVVKVEPGSGAQNEWALQTITVE